MVVNWILNRTVNRVLYKMEERAERKRERGSRLLERAFRKRLPTMSDEDVMGLYASVARDVGAMITLTCYGMPVDLPRAVKDLRFWEKAYVDRGYRPIDRKNLSERMCSAASGGIDDLLGQKLEQNEKPVLYAPKLLEDIHEYIVRMKREARQNEARR